MINSVIPMPMDTVFMNVIKMKITIVIRNVSSMMRKIKFVLNFVKPIKMASVFMIVLRIQMKTALIRVFAMIKTLNVNNIAKLILKVIVYAN